ncbi:leiomodin-2a isoform X2 [Pimephales promelas]|uniref:leiomodin-2a isoform X2 n=1 Tax=Pimephales promelas TaxID=90988 RepID=UPI001955BFB6|nr:leiomodin-2a isoform X2 [Pimephales promelas]KAG1933313.1 tropomodulin-2 [Pimephales promelas]
MSNFGYRKELGKYEDIDEDELLASLTSEELQELEKAMAEMEPDENIPTGLRQEDQTAKRPTGAFCREALLKYWEDETHRLLEDSMDECQTDKSEQECGSEEPEDNEEQQNEGFRKGGDGEKKVRSSNCNFVDLDCIRVRKPNGINEVALHHHISPDRPSSNPTDIDKTLENILSNDTSLSEVNLNNIENISQGVLVSFANALISNTHVEVFSIANTHGDDQVALALAKMLKKNCSITNLNVESNFISGKGILALIGSLQYNTTLVELRFHNQRHICGGQVEMEMVRLLRKNTTLLKLGYHFDLPGPRMSATAILTRNQDSQRQKRLQQRKEQGNLERSAGQSNTWETTDNTQSFQFHIPTDKDTTLTKQNLVSSHLQQPHSQPNSVKNVPTRKIAEMVKQQEETAMDNNQANANKGHKLTGDKHGKNIQDEKILPLRRKDDTNNLGGAQGSTRDDLLAAIRGSSIGTLRRVTNHHCS